MKIQEMIENAELIGVAGHVRPDGDCVGSCMGLVKYLRTWYPEKQVDVYLEEIPNKFKFLCETETIKHEAEERIYDLFICLDCGDADRLGFAKEMFCNAKKQGCVDHHISNTATGEFYLIDPDASSTSELVYELLDAEKITAEIAKCFFVGIVHDTGVFQYSCTSPKTMRIAASLMEKDIEPSAIIEDTFYERTMTQNILLGKALKDSKSILEGRGLLYTFTKEDFQRYHAKAKDLDGIVSMMRNTKGIDVAILIYELEEGDFKVSIRSNEKVDASKVAGCFGGGGHKKAAGFNLHENVDHLIEEVLEKISVQLVEER